MPTTLGTFHALVRETLNRGTALDAVFPARVRMAARVLERNIDMQYMRRWGEISVDASVARPHVVSLFGFSFKAIDAVRITDYQEDDRFKDLVLIDPKDRTQRKAGVPSAYWLDGVSNLIFDAIPGDDMTLEIHFRQFTDWGTGTSWTHWLLDNAEDVLLAQTMMLMGVRLRDQRLYEMHKMARDEAMTTLSSSQEEIAMANADPVMQWAPGGMSTGDWNDSELLYTDDPR